MGIAYLENKEWWKWSRDERMFCAVLWEHGRKDPARFARWLIKTAELEIDTAGDWDLGYEVVFYRDFLWKYGDSAKEKGFSPKRTFDLCLFGEKHLIVIEAKMCTGFAPEDVESFKNDIEQLPKAIEGLTPAIHVVGLACSSYWSNLKKHGAEETKKFFQHYICWKDADEEYIDPKLEKADGMHIRELERKSKNRRRNKENDS